MPWSDQSGGGRNNGPWGSGGGGGGPWGGGQQGGPWGGGPQRPGGPGGPGGGSPDLEELLRKSQERLKKVFPGGGGGQGGKGPSLGGLGMKGAGIAAGVVLILYGLTGFYRVEPGEVGVELVLGQYQGMTEPGLNYNWPYPVGQVFTPDVLRVREINVGIRDVGGPGTAGRDVPEESLMLTGDENIVDVDFKVQWRISNAPAFLFNIEDPAATVKQVAESAMREVIGRNDIQPILTQQRQQVETSVQDLMQTTLDEYGAGVEVSEVQMQKVDPPAEVIGAFRDVQAARADQERLQNEADAFANRVVPEARGEAARIIEQATGYRDRVVAEARGEADRFISIYDEYAKAPEVTRDRIYLETLERVFEGTDKVIIDSSAGNNGVVPYLPLDQLRSTGRTTGADQ